MSFCVNLVFTVQAAFSDSKPKVKNLTNGAVLELFEHGRSVNAKTIDVVQIMCEICDVKDANITACRSKVYRMIDADKKKRADDRDSYRNNIFHFPSSVPTLSTTDSTPEVKPSIDVSESKIEELRNIKEANRMLKRKVTRREDSIERKVAAKTRKLEKITESTEQKLEKSEASLKQKTEILEKKRQKHSQDILSIRQLNNYVKILKKHINGVNVMLEERSREHKVQEEEYSILQHKNKELEKSVEYLQGLINDTDEIIVCDPSINIYSNRLIECVMNLTNLKIATKNVGPVIQEVATRVNRLPSRQTVDNIVDRKVSMSQKQVSQITAKEKDTTLYTDETRKHGHTYQTYILTDKSQNSYLLGLREMVNKSAQCTLDVLKEILFDISAHCKELSEAKNFSVGYELLCNITNTMSDRASTEKAFNTLLQNYKEEVLPKVIDNYDELSVEEKSHCGKINNFFCGLHLLCGMADVCEAGMKKYETGFLDGKEIGSSVRPELKRFHKSESGTLRLLRSCSKAFARGEDEKMECICLLLHI
ncbi:hypothetical protein SNE40_012681 [Patella caerulea]|uniref:Uncharacterized protein n=1 Tax=Patella caerulea TaxID=87958 RepID=A0AAN8JUW3_PATCE